MQTMAVMTEPPARLEHLQPTARRLVWVLFALALANGAFLYLLPHLAKEHYAWAIQPPINAAFMGAGYAAGMVATGLALFTARYWRSVRTLFPGFFVLGGSLFLATLLHASRFKWDYALTWMWTLIYFSIPFGSALTWWQHERSNAKPEPRDARFDRMRFGSLVLGVIVTVFALMLFVMPQWFLEAWPWPITPLLARVFAGWYFLAGVLLLTVGVSLRHAREIPVAFLTLVAWNALSLLLVIFHSDSIRFGSSLWAWALAHGLMLVFTVWASGLALRVMRLEGQAL